MKKPDGDPFIIMRDLATRTAAPGSSINPKNQSLFGHSLGTTFNFKRVDTKYRREAIYTEFKSNAFVAWITSTGKSSYV